MTAKFLVRVGVKELRYKWRLSDLITQTCFFGMIGFLSGWWAAQRLGSIALRMQLFSLAFFTAVPLGVRRRISRESRFLESLAVPTALRVCYVACAAAVQGAQVALPLGLGIGAGYCFVAGSFRWSLTFDALVLGAGLLTGASIATISMNMIDPAQFTWPWRSSLRGFVYTLVRTRPFLGVQVAKTIRRPLGVSFMIVASLIATVCSALSPRYLVATLTILAFFPTIWAIVAAQNDPALPLIANLPKGVVAWLRAQVLVIGMVSVLPALPALGLVAFWGHLRPFELPMIALFWLTSIFVGTAAGGAFGALTWRPVLSADHLAVSAIVGTLLWGVPTILAASYTLPPEHYTLPGSGVAAVLTGLLFGASTILLSWAAAKVERRDRFGLLDEA